MFESEDFRRIYVESLEVELIIVSVYIFLFDHQ